MSLIWIFIRSFSRLVDLIDWCDLVVCLNACNVDSYCLLFVVVD